MQAQQAGRAAGEGEGVGWQDSDSEGFINDWEVESLPEEVQQPHGAAEHAARAASQQLHLNQQQQQQQQQPDTQHNAEVTTPVLRPQDVGQHTADYEQQQAPAEQQQQQQRPLRRHIAALLHNRVVAVLRQQLAGTNAGQEAAGGFDEDIALRLLHEAQQEVTAAAAAEGLQGASSTEFDSVDDDPDTGLTDDMQQDTEEEEPAEGCVHFDPNVTASHTYLGDVDELEGGYGHLQPGTTARLPLLMLEGVVLFPGCQLPLLLSTSSQQHLLNRALTAQPPLTRLLAVMPGLRSGMVYQPRMVCCTAEVRQMRRQEADGAVAVLALGRQRAEVIDNRHMAQSQSSVQVCILYEGCQSSVPQPLRCFASAIHPALTAPWDLRLLVNRVRELIQLVLMPVASFQGTPLELSYWVSHNLPLQPSTRQLLLTADSPAERLRMLLGLLERLDQLSCSACGTVLATTADVLAMTSEGIAGTFVNSAGYVHEMVTFKRVHGVVLEGHPETAHSWFPGYAWTIAYCGTCGQHLGWRFTAALQHLSPRMFWGLRRPVLTCRTRPAPAAAPAGTAQDAGQQQQEQEQQEHDGGGHEARIAGTIVIPLGRMPARIVEQQEEEGTE